MSKKIDNLDAEMMDLPELLEKKCEISKNSINSVQLDELPELLEKKCEISKNPVKLEHQFNELFPELQEKKCEISKNSLKLDGQVGESKKPLLKSSTLHNITSRNKINASIPTEEQCRFLGNLKLSDPKRERMNKRVEKKWKTSNIPNNWKCKSDYSENNTQKPKRKGKILERYYNCL